MTEKTRHARRFTRFEAILVVLLIGSIGFALKGLISINTPIGQDNSADSLLDDSETFEDLPPGDEDQLFLDPDKEDAADAGYQAIQSLHSVTNRPVPGMAAVRSASRSSGSNSEPTGAQNDAVDGFGNQFQQANEPYDAQADGTQEATGTGSRKIPGVREHVIDAPPPVMSILDRLAGQEWSRDTEQQLLESIRVWASLDMQSALEFALTIDRRGARETAMNDSLNAWLNTAPQDAEKWFLQKAADEPFLMGGLVNKFFASYAEKSPDQAINAVWQVVDPGMKRAALQAVAQQCMAANRESDIMNLYDSVKGSQNKKLVIDAIMQNMARYEPLALGQWALSITDKSQRSTAINSLVCNWAKDCPSAAADWVTSNVTLEGRSKQLANVAQAWAREDPIEAGDWLLTLFPPSKDTDPAVDIFARSVLQVDPAYASEWASAVTDQRTRWRLMEQVARTWKNSNPEAARVYVKQTDLPPKIKSRLLK